MAEAGQVTNNQARSRFELAAGDAVAIAQYQIDGDIIHMTHTVVPQEMEGQGIGSRLVKGALDDARRRGLQVDPVCPFVRAYIERHPEYQDLLG